MLWAPLCSKLKQYGAVRLVSWILSIGWTQQVMDTWIPDSHFWILYMQVSWVQMFTHVTAEGGVTMLSSCAERMSMELQQKPRLWRRVLLHDKSVTSMGPLSEYGRGPLWEFLKVFGLDVNFFVVLKELKWNGDSWIHVVLLLLSDQRLELAVVPCSSLHGIKLKL